MILAFFKYEFAGLWPLLWHFGIGGIIVLSCVLLYAFTPQILLKIFPNIQRVLLWVASVVIAIMISVAVGVSLGEARIRAQCDAEKQNAIEAAQEARANARRDLARKPSRFLPNHKRPDADCRDC